ncbi:MAG TPA: TonB family protein [Blastocatellia bacterium]
MTTRALRNIVIGASLFCLFALGSPAAPVGQGDSAAAHIEGGQAAYAKKDYKVAIDEFKKARSLDKTLAEPYVMLARCYVLTGKNQDAIKELKQAVKQQPGDSGAHFALARCYYYANDIDNSRKELAAALKYGAKGPAVLQLSAEMRMLDGDYGGALAQYQEALQTAGPNDPGLALLRDKIFALGNYLDFQKHEVSPTLVMPRFLNRPRPNYTPEARDNHVQGAVREMVLIDKTGTVQTVILKTRLGYGLDEEAVKATRMVKFQPATDNGEPVPFWAVFEVEFNLN